MFRKGGEAMTGIMENVSPRQNYAETGNVYDEADAIITERMGPVQKGDPLTDFLLTYGPSLAKSALPGGLLRNVVAAADDPLKQTLKNRADFRDRQEARKLAGIQLGESMAERQLKRDLAEMKGGIDLLPTFLDLYEGNLTLAQNRNTYEKSGLQSRAKDAFGKNFAGLVGGDRHGDIESKTFKNKKNVGKVYYDIEDGQFKQILEKKVGGGFGVKVVDINTYDAEAAKGTPDPKKTKPGLFGQKSKPKQTFKEAFEIEDKETFDPFGGA